MPIYEYRCSKCGHELEALQKLADAPLTTCPACQAVALVKQMSAAGFQLKGSGWYATDFRGGRAGKPAEVRTRRETREPTRKPRREAGREARRRFARRSQERQPRPPPTLGGCDHSCARH